jgi:hypothetical protein
MRITPIEMKAFKLYNKLEIGEFFNTYHDLMYGLIQEFDYLEDDNEDDYRIALENLEKCRAIIRAQNILMKAEVN